MNLRDLLLTGYDRDIRPPIDQTYAINVSLTLSLVGIQDFDEIMGKFSTIALLVATWEDDRLEWVPSSHNSIASLTVKKKHIWVPEIMLGNPYTNIDIGRDAFPLHVFPNGTVVWSFGDVMKTFCSVDLTFYPFDVQICALQFAVWGISYKEIKLVNTLSEVAMNFYEGNGEWTITGTNANVSILGGSTIVSFFIKMERESAFVLLNVATPIFILSFINPFAFALPTSSGERVSYAVTILLSVSVYLTMVSDTMPKSSNPMSHMTYALIVQFLMSCIMCIFSIYTMYLYDIANKKRPIPNYLKVLCRGCCKSSNTSAVEPIGTNVDARENGLFNYSQCTKVACDNAHELTWECACCRLDRLLFIIFLVVIILCDAITTSALYLQRHNKQL